MLRAPVRIELTAFFLPRRRSTTELRGPVVVFVHCCHQPRRPESAGLAKWRCRPDSNRRKQLCRLPPGLSVTAPSRRTVRAPGGSHCLHLRADDRTRTCNSLALDQRPLTNWDTSAWVLLCGLMCEIRKRADDRSRTCNAPGLSRRPLPRWDTSALAAHGTSPGGLTGRVQCSHERARTSNIPINNRTLCH
jgi:hypothetical protein